MPTILQRQLNVRSGSGGIYTGNALFVSSNWAVEGNTVQLNFANRAQLGLTIDHIESVFIDNSQGTGSVRLVIASPPQTITVAPGSVTNSHLDVSGLDNPILIQVGFVGALGNVGGATQFIFRDYPVGSSASIIGGATTGSSTTDTTLLSVQQADPADNHASLRVHDLGSYNVLSALQSLLQGTLTTHDTVLDALVTGGKLPVSDSALEALISGGKLAVADATLEGVVSGGKLGVTDAATVSLAALIASGKLAVADASLEALITSGRFSVVNTALELALRGNAAATRLAAQLLDASANPLGVSGNPLIVSTTNNTGMPTPLYTSFFSSSATATYNMLGMSSVPCNLYCLDASNNSGVGVMVTLSDIYSSTMSSMTGNNVKARFILQNGVAARTTVNFSPPIPFLVGLSVAFCTPDGTNSGTTAAGAGVNLHWHA